jgi:hypothetical protein
MLVAGVDTANQLFDGSGLIAAWLIGALQLEIHGERLLSLKAAEGNP